jgi:hypothetical protein
MWKRTVLVVVLSVVLSTLTTLSLIALRLLSAPSLIGAGGQGATRNGDVNCDGRLDVSDAIHTLSFLFLGGQAPCALAEAPDPCCPEVVQALERIAAAVEDRCTDALRRFVRNGDGTVTDTCLGIVWLADRVRVDVNSDGSPDFDATWLQARTAAESFTFAGFSDWRLPTTKEFESLILFLAAQNYDVNHLPDFDFNFAGISNDIYWSSSEVPQGSGNVYVANLSRFSLRLSREGVFDQRRFMLFVRGPMVE